MAVEGFRLVGAAGNVVEPAAVEVLGSAIISVGDIVQFDRFAESNGLVKRAVSTGGPILLFGIAASALASATGVVKVIPIVPGQIWEASCTNEPRAEQVLMRHVLTDHKTIANTAIDQSTSLGVFLMFALSRGSACIGEFIRVPQNLSRHDGADGYFD